MSLECVPRLSYSRVAQSLLSDIPTLENLSHGSGEGKEGGGTVIREHVLDFLLRMNHSEEADNHVPVSVSNLVVTKLEMELDSVEFELLKVMSDDMVKDGYAEIMNIDISSVDNNMMRKKYEESPQMKYMQMDVEDMSFFPDDSFDSVIDKGSDDDNHCGISI